MLTKPELSLLKETYKLKAYYIEVKNGLEYEGEVVFAKSEKAAKQRVGAIGDGSWDNEYLSKVEREPKFDKFAGLGYVPLKDKFEHGWTDIECDWCGREISDSAIGNFEDELLDWEEDHYEGESSPEPYNPQFEGRNMAFCCTNCQTMWHQAIAKHKEKKAEIKKYIEEKYPECSIKSVTGGFRNFPVYVEFTFPGGKYSVKYRTDMPDIVSVSQCDVELWKQYKESKYD
jgi:hypothetical protein